LTFVFLHICFDFVDHVYCIIPYFCVALRCVIDELGELCDVAGRLLVEVSRRSSCLAIQAMSGGHVCCLSTA